jgi:hypothetical protein
MSVIKTPYLKYFNEPSLLKKHQTWMNVFYVFILKTSQSPAKIFIARILPTIRLKTKVTDDFLFRRLPRALTAGAKTVEVIFAQPPDVIGVFKQDSFKKFFWKN